MIEYNIRAEKEHILKNRNPLYLIMRLQTKMPKIVSKTEILNELKEIFKGRDNPNYGGTV